MPTILLIYKVSNKNLCVKEIFVVFLLIEAVSCIVKVNGLAYKESC